MNQSIVFSPDTDDRQLDREVSKIDDRLGEIDETITPEVDTSSMDGVGSGISDGRGGGGGGGMGQAAGIGALASKIPAPIGAVAAGAAIPTAMVGGVGVGMLSAMQSASARMQTSMSLLSQAWNNVWRPIGDRVDDIFIRDVVTDLLGVTEDFEENLRGFAELGPDGILGAITIGEELDLAIEKTIKENLPSFSWPSLPDFSWPDIAGMWPGWPSIDADWPGFPNIKSEWGGWPNIKGQWAGWPDIGMPNIPDWSDMKPGIPDWRDTTPGIPDWRDLVPSLPDWSDLNPLDGGDNGNSSSDNGSSGGSGSSPDSGSNDGSAPDSGSSGSGSGGDPDDISDVMPGGDYGNTDGGSSGGGSDYEDPSWSGGGASYFAEGGIVNGPTNAVIGEAGPEAVLPLDSFLRDLQGTIRSGMSEGGDGGGGGGGDLRRVESKLDDVNRNLKRLSDAMSDMSLNVDGETFGRAASNTRRNSVSDTDPLA